MKHIEKIDFDKFTLDNGWAGQHYNQLKFFITQSHTSFIQDLIQRVGGERKEVGHILKCKMCSPKCGYNSALDTIIKMLKEEI
jgi:indole-3-glycerol phosphate synthase